MKRLASLDILPCDHIERLFFGGVPPHLSPLWGERLA